ncbi:hypothetical protein GCM10019071_08780 [Sphingobium fuliginis]|uniref:Uncharacterized protein n=1 Tax=Sphingobium fuliginis (strain ATCC 27551) TaxID=336203 RepID=A0ABQ1EQC4_SPHSA|nr:hypothetical protein GCM10019071_08780 [Sphingobium fuliginis]
MRAQPSCPIIRQGGGPAPDPCKQDRPIGKGNPNPAAAMERRVKPDAGRALEFSAVASFSAASFSAQNTHPRPAQDRRFCAMPYPALRSNTAPIMLRQTATSPACAICASGSRSVCRIA